MLNAAGSDGKKNISGDRTTNKNVKTEGSGTEVKKKMSNRRANQTNHGTSLDGENRESRSAKIQGELAFRHGFDVDECPYRCQNHNRQFWMIGWYDAFFAKKHREMNLRWGLLD